MPFKRILMTSSLMSLAAPFEGRPKTIRVLLDHGPRVPPLPFLRQNDLTWTLQRFLHASFQVSVFVDKVRTACIHLGSSGAKDATCGLELKSLKRLPGFARSQLLDLSLVAG